MLTVSDHHQHDEGTPGPCSHGRTMWTRMRCIAGAGRSPQSLGTWAMTARPSAPICTRAGSPGSADGPNRTASVHVRRLHTLRCHQRPIRSLPTRRIRRARARHGPGPGAATGLDEHPVHTPGSHRSRPPRRPVVSGRLAVTEQARWFPAVRGLAAGWFPRASVAGPGLRLWCDRCWRVAKRREAPISGPVLLGGWVSSPPPCRPWPGDHGPASRPK